MFVKTIELMFVTIIKSIRPNQSVGMIVKDIKK